MPKPPTLGACFETAVPNTARTRKKVRIASNRTAWPNPRPGARVGTPRLEAKTTPAGKTSLTPTAPMIPATSWVTM